MAQKPTEYWGYPVIDGVSPKLLKVCNCKNDIKNLKTEKQQLLEKVFELQQEIDKLRSDKSCLQRKLNYEIDEKHELTKKCEGLEQDITSNQKHLDYARNLLVDREKLVNRFSNKYGSLDENYVIFSSDDSGSVDEK
jgi:chromosome segregation ATPase